jgi:hypothetical protein
MNKAHVICYNDSIEFIFFGTDSDARLKLEQLAKEEYEQGYTSYYKDYNDYVDSHYWHIRLVESNL